MKTSLKARVTFFVLFCFFDFLFFRFFFVLITFCNGQKYQKWKKKNEISSLKGKRDTQMKNNLKSEKRKRIDDSL